MIKSITELVRLLSPAQRRELLLLQFLVILMALAEIVAVASIGPFMALIGNIGILEQDNPVAHFYHRLDGVTPQDFLIHAGLLALCMLALSAVISILTLWRLAIFGSKVGIELGDRLFAYYMHQPWLFHAASSSALLNKKIAADTAQVTGQIIQPLLSMNARLVLIIFMIIPVVIFNPLVALVGVGVLVSAYFIIYRLVRMQLIRNGRSISAASGQRYTLVSEGLGGIKDLLLLGRQESFIRRFTESGSHIFRGLGSHQAIVGSPRYLMEVLAFGLIILLVVYLVDSFDGDLGAVLPTLAIYALAGFKLLPAFQNIYLSIANIRSGMPAFEAIRDDLLASDSASLPKALTGTAATAIEVLGEIRLSDIVFTYPGKAVPALARLDMVIPARKVVGIVGATGSGKSTTIDIILGLIKPDSGVVAIDGKPLHAGMMRAWQDSLGYVPQTIYLANASILENVAFGLPPGQIDADRARKAMSMAHLDEMLGQLPEGMHTLVGERGVQLSGGQRQRIGIARALYHDAQVLVLDEATSALDGITERIIMEAIQDFAGQKTIIMIAHRFATIRQCDIIYLMDKGAVTDCGSYDELLARNEMFRKMAMHTE